MRLVEVVMLMGAHCVSPVEHGQMMTEVAKVQCAVVIEKDSESGAVTVTPREAARDPHVAADMARFGAAPVDLANDDVIRIVPAWAPPGAPATEVKAKPIVPPPALQDAPAASAPRPAAPVIVTQPAAQDEAAPAKKVATLTSPPPTRKATAKKVEKAAVSRPAPRCTAGATAKWYRTADGQRKFRCVMPGGAPAQLY